MIHKKNLQILESKKKLARNVLYSVGVCSLCSCHSTMAMENTPKGSSNQETSSVHASKVSNTGKAENQGIATASQCCSIATAEKEYPEIFKTVYPFDTAVGEGADDHPDPISPNILAEMAEINNAFLHDTDLLDIKKLNDQKEDHED